MQRLVLLLCIVTSNAIAEGDVTHASRANRVIRFKHCTGPIEMVQEITPHELILGDVVVSRWLLSHPDPLVHRDLVEVLEDGLVELYFTVDPGMPPALFTVPEHEGKLYPRFIFNFFHMGMAELRNVPLLYRVLSHEGQHALDYIAGSLTIIPGDSEPLPADLIMMFKAELRAHLTECSVGVAYGFFGPGFVPNNRDPCESFASGGREGLAHWASSAYQNDPRFYSIGSLLPSAANEWLCENEVTTDARAISD